MSSSQVEEQAKWLPLESNPEAMNKFLRGIGIPPPTQCVDVLGFDDDLAAFLPQPIYAILFCFPDYHKLKAVFKPTYDKLAEEGAAAAVPKDIFFMEQSISNACGTFAIFHSLANNADKINLGDGSFKSWLDRAKETPAKERSKLLEQDKTLAAAHESCAQGGRTDVPEHVEHHFICYVNKDGRLLEIDSARSFPRDCGATSTATFVRDAGAVCQEFMKHANSASFSAIALVGGSLDG